MSGALVLTILCGLAGASAQGAQPVTELQLLDPASGERVIVRPEGKVLHLVFFATWCPPCTEELPGLADLDARWQDSGYSLVMVAVPSRQDPERLLAFQQEERPPGRLLLDRSGAALKTMAVVDLPAHVLIDGDGVVVLRAEGLSEGVAEMVEEMIGN